MHGIHETASTLARALDIPRGQAIQLLNAMRDGSSLAAAARREGIDLNQMSAGELQALVDSAPAEMQPQFTQDADLLPAALREALPGSTPTDNPDSGTPTTGAGAPGDADTSSATGAAPGTAAPDDGTASTSNYTNQPGMPPGQQGRMNADTPFVPQLPFQSSGQTDARPVNSPISSLIDRLFTDTSARTDSTTQNLNLPTARGLTSPDAVQNPTGILHARNDSPGAPPGQIGRDVPPGQVGRETLPPGLQNAFAQGRSEGNQGGYSPASQASNAALASQTAPQQAASQQAAAYQSGSQSTSPAPFADRASTSTPLPAQAQARGGEGAAVAARAPDAVPAPTQMDRLNAQTPLLAQQQQQAAPVQGRPDLAAGTQVLPQLAGATLLANPQAHTMATQVGQNVMPAPAGVETSAARDMLMAPLGHTLAGFLRRDARNGQSPAERRENWLLSLLPGRQKRRMDGGTPDPMSFQWLFWMLTVAAYGALATAIIIMVPSGGRLIQTDGSPNMGVYALAIGAIAALAAWWLEKRVAKTTSRTH